MKERILIVGSESHVDRAAAAARKAGLDPVSHANPPRNPEVLAETARNSDIAGLYSADEAHLELVAGAAKSLGLPACSPETARVLRDKEALRTLLAKHTRLNPRYGVADSLTGTENSISGLGLPAVVKPVDGCGGTGSLIVRDIADAPLAFTRASKASSNGRVIVEPYLPGQEYRVICHRGNGRWSTITVYSNVPAEHDHLFDRAQVAPVRVVGALRDKMRESVRAVMGLLRGVHGVIVLEFFVSHEGLHLIELGRISHIPALATQLFPAISGINLLEVDVATAMGRPFDTKPRFKACGALWWLHAKSGVVTAINGMEKARSVPGVAGVEVTAKVGAVLGHQVDCPSRDAVGYVLATARTARRAIEKAQYASEYLRFETHAALEE